MRGEAFGLVCAETPARSFQDVRGNAHPVFPVFNARVASSWKLRKLVLFGALLVSLSRDCFKLSSATKFNL